MTSRKSTMTSTELHRIRERNHLTHHRKILWMHFANLFLGAWLLMTPMTYAYHDSAMVINDMLCGVWIVVFSALSLNPFRFWAPWATAFTGLWLSVSPLVFWAPEAQLYNND